MRFDKVKNDGFMGKGFSVIATMTLVASMVAMFAMICAKSISVLFKLNKALDLYIREQESRHEHEMKMNHLRGGYDDEEEISL